jgi:hypothetical protein
MLGLQSAAAPSASAAAAAAGAAVPPPPMKVNEDKLKQLTQLMGFRAEASTRALLLNRCRRRSASRPSRNH